MTLSHYWRLVDSQARFALKADATKYFLGYLWWVLEPLLFVGVFYVVFDIILQSGRGDFLVFLMCGKLPFAWFSKGVNTASNSIVSNVGLIAKIDIPKSIFPMSKILECTYRQFAVFGLLFGVLIWNEYSVTMLWFWLIPLVILQFLMIVSCSLIGSILVCIVRDFSVLIGLSMVFLMFSSGIFWDVRSLSNPEMTQLILTWNPLAFLLDAYRQVLMFEQVPDIVRLLWNILGFGALAFLIARLMHANGQRLALSALTS
jgi:lipopolysaccharide transport system permease protein